MRLLSRSLVPVRARLAGALACLAVLSACGGGGGDDTPVISLGITVTQVGPRTVRVDWTDDPAAAFFRIRGEGTPLADVDALTYIDTTVFAGYRYCYDVQGYDANRYLTATSAVSCIFVQ